MSGEVILRVPRASDEAEVLAAQAELAAEGFLFVFQKPGQSWEDYVASTEHQSAGAELPPGRIPATMLLAEVEEVIVGRVHIRHKLTAELRKVGGHIGYAVRPAFRRRGYATQMLRSALEVCRDLGLQQVLLTCDHNNLGSIITIERCGGVLEDIHTPPEGPAKRRYWIDLGEGLHYA